MSHPSLVGRLAVSAVLASTALVPALAGSPADAAGAAETAGAAGAASPLGAAASAPPRPKRPNVVVVLADDLGWSDISTGLTNKDNPSDYNETPAIAKLSRQGVSFDNAYQCLNCAPTRAAMMSGVSAARDQNGIFAVDNLNRGGADTLLVGPEQGDEINDDALPASTRTIAETMDRAGYDTGYMGKFHVTRDAGDITTVHGWDENWGGTQSANATNYFAVDGQFNDSVSPSLDEYAQPYTEEYVEENIAPFSHGVSQEQLDALVGTQKHVTDAVTDAALGFVDRHRRQPFFAFMGEYAVHDPVGDKQARTDLLAKYQAKAPGATPSKASYAAIIEGLDQSVARLVDHLRTTPDPRYPGHPLADNTLVIFASDNGGRTDLGAYNGPLKGQKAELDEGGVRVPFIAWSDNPQLVRGRRVESTPINSTDLYPTLADLGKASLPRNVPFDGTSLRTLISRGGSIDRSLFQHMPGYVVKDGQDQRPQSYVRDGRWKLLYSYETDDWDLYDLHADLGETDDLAEQKPGVVARLGDELIRWLDRTDAPLATLREGKEPITLTVDGTTYADGRRRHYDGETLTIEPGQEVPLVLQDR